MSSQTVNPQIGFQFPEAIKKDHRERKPLVLEIMGWNHSKSISNKSKPPKCYDKWKKSFWDDFSIWYYRPVHFFQPEILTTLKLIHQLFRQP